MHGLNIRTDLLHCDALVFIVCTTTIIAIKLPFLCIIILSNTCELDLLKGLSRMCHQIGVHIKFERMVHE
jgi:hypothetical protein